MPEYRNNHYDGKSTLLSLAYKIALRAVETSREAAEEHSNERIVLAWLGQFEMVLHLLHHHR